jgi:hypothetical protein
MSQTKGEKKAPKSAESVDQSGCNEVSVCHELVAHNSSSNSETMPVKAIDPIVPEVHGAPLKNFSSAPFVEVRNKKKTLIKNVKPIEPKNNLNLIPSAPCFTLSILNLDEKNLSSLIKTFRKYISVKPSSSCEKKYYVYSDSCWVLKRIIAESESKNYNWDSIVRTSDSAILRAVDCSTFSSVTSFLNGRSVYSPKSLFVESSSLFGFSINDLRSFFPTAKYVKALHNRRFLIEFELQDSELVKAILKSTSLGSLLVSWKLFVPSPKVNCELGCSFCDKSIHCKNFSQMFKIALIRKTIAVKNYLHLETEVDTTLLKGLLDKSRSRMQSSAVVVDSHFSSKKPKQCEKSSSDVCFAQIVKNQSKKHPLPVLPTDSSSKGLKSTIDSLLCRIKDLEAKVNSLSNLESKFDLFMEKFDSFISKASSFSSKSNPASSDSGSKAIIVPVSDPNTLSNPSHQLSLKRSLRSKSIGPPLMNGYLNCSCGKPFRNNPGWCNHFRSCKGYVSCLCRKASMDSASAFMEFRKHIESCSVFDLDTRVPLQQ